MIYKKNQLERMAAEQLCEFVLANKKYHFNNTSYGLRGDVLGTANYTDRSSEHFIGYTLRNTYLNDGYKYELIKATEDTYYKTDTQEYRKDENEEVLLTLFDIDYSDRIFTDDKDAATKASQIRYSRRSRRSAKDRLATLNRTWTVNVGSDLYNKLFGFLYKSKPQLKYGKPITVTKYAFDTVRYTTDKDGNYQRVGVYQVSIDVSIEYRNQSYCVEKKKFYIDKVEH